MRKTGKHYLHAYQSPSSATAIVQLLLPRGPSGLGVGVGVGGWVGGWVEGCGWVGGCSVCVCGERGREGGREGGRKMVVMAAAEGVEPGGAVCVEEEIGPSVLLILFGVHIEE